ncbi:MAG: chemotaxis protein CheB [Sneathiellaceae bacterium]
MTERDPMPPSPTPATRTGSTPSTGVPEADAADFPVVAIGASAGGLDACRRFLDALPDRAGMAFILVQHLDPTVESMVADLLAPHTSMIVQQAVDGMPVERDHLYVIPPGHYLAVRGGALRLVAPPAQHGARLPFDFLLRTLAEDCGARAACVILSGTGGDGSIGLEAIKSVWGLVIVQDPDEAGFDAMPQNAILTGMVDAVLPVAKIPHALTALSTQRATFGMEGHTAPWSRENNTLSEIIDLLRARTRHDFGLYKRGTLQRRIERSMSLLKVEAGDMQRYLELLQQDPGQLELLAKELLINVTCFFRDPAMFDYLSDKVIPGMIENWPADQPIRIWVAGCSTGEEAFSLAILFHEQIAAAKRQLRLQIFATDANPDAIAVAREGLYSAGIEADVSRERLDNFFTRDGDAYRISSQLRAAVVFAVQDVLADPPFSRLDVVSCRNLMIYLRPEAQAKAISLFHFALRAGGLLLLGSAETVGNIAGRFESLSSNLRIYRRSEGETRPGDISLVARRPAGQSIAPSIALSPDPTKARTHPVRLADLCRQLLLEEYIPASILINDAYECLHFLGPTERFLRIKSGAPSHDLLSLVDIQLRAKIRASIQQCREGGGRISTFGDRPDQDGLDAPFRIDVRAVPSEGVTLFLISFVDLPRGTEVAETPSAPGNQTQVVELQRELAATRVELQSAIRNLESANEEYKATAAEALSMNEEHQATNEELLASKEELQSMNEELTVLNIQIQEALQRQRTTTDDLQNVLISTDVATLFLDRDLNIRFFTPAIRRLFRFIESDVGRPFADLHGIARDPDLMKDAEQVLQTLIPCERDIELEGDAWFMRRVTPYHTQDKRIEGVVVTFSDVTERRRVAGRQERAVDAATQSSETKTRYLAATSHDLRQPLQTLTLLQGQLAALVKDEPAHTLIANLGQVLRSMSNIVNTLLDLNQIESGGIRASKSPVRVGEILNRLQDAFAYQASTHGTTLRVVPCSLPIHTDPRLLEHILRNLVSNALNYAQGGTVLLGCRRHARKVVIQVWDTGPGIPEAQHDAIFKAYHQLDDPSRLQNQGLGLGLSIARQLADVLGHPLGVQSRLGKGSVFSVEVDRASGPAPVATPGEPDTQTRRPGPRPARPGTIVVVEDDAQMRALIELQLTGEGHGVISAPDGRTALQLVAEDTRPLDLALVNYNLPHGVNGLMVVSRLRKMLNRQLPAVVLTGHISAGTIHEIRAQDCEVLTKPVTGAELSDAIHYLLADALPVGGNEGAHDDGMITPPQSAVVYIIDDDPGICAALRELLEGNGWTVKDFQTSEAFLESYRPATEGCLLVDAYLPGISGIQLLRRLREAGDQLPAIVITGKSDVTTAVEAMKAGAIDFVTKPVSGPRLLAEVERALERARRTTQDSSFAAEAAKLTAVLTPRQRQILERVSAGASSKTIADEMKISVRTVENHRAAIIKKTGIKSVAKLARLAFAAKQIAEEA